MTEPGKDPKLTGSERRDQSLDDQTQGSATSQTEDSRKTKKSARRADGRDNGTLTARKERQKQIARMVLDGVPYAQIHDNVNPPFNTANPEHKAQVVYSSLQKQGTQDAIAALLPEYDEPYLRRKLTRIMEFTPDYCPDGPQVKVIELAMKEKGMLKDVQEVNINTTILSVSIESESRKALESLGLAGAIESEPDKA